MSATWYWKDQDIRKGPVTSQQLKALAQAGRIRLDTMVQKKGMQEWVSAAQLKGLFDASAANAQPTARPDGDAVVSRIVGPAKTLPPPLPRSAQPPQPSSQWYYTIDGHQAGPVSIAELRQIAEDGFITRETLLWQPGLSEWVPASKVQLGFDLNRLISNDDCFIPGRIQNWITSVSSSPPNSLPHAPPHAARAGYAGNRRSEHAAGHCRSHAITLAWGRVVRDLSHRARSADFPG